MNFEIASASGAPDHRVTYNDDWRCDCKGFMYRHKCRHITEAQQQIEYKSPVPVKWDRRWWYGCRDGQTVYWQMLFGVGGPVTVFDGQVSYLVAWGDVTIESVRWLGELVEADSPVVESAYFNHLVHRKDVTCT